MLNALRFELVRLSSLRSTWILLTIGLMLHLALTLNFAGDDMTPVNEQLDLTFNYSLILVPIFSTAVAVAAFGHDYRYRTITPTVLTLQSRGKVLAAKAFMASGVALITSAVLMAATLLVQLFYGDFPEWGAIGWIFLVVTAYTVLSALVGLGLAAVTRNSMIAMVVVITVPAVLEPLVAMAEWIDVRALPFMRAADLLDLSTDMSVWSGLLPLLALTTAVLAAGGMSLIRRDA